MPRRVARESPSTRALNACQRCRRRKVRCSGSCPCTQCARVNAECHFEGNGRKVLVSQRYLEELRRAADVSSCQPDQDARPTGSSPAAPASEDTHARPNNTTQAHQAPLQTTSAASIPSTAAVPESEPSNPLATADSTYVTDIEGRLRWLGESSTWSFSRKVLLMMRSHLSNPQLPNIDIHEESRAYTLSWGYSSFDDPGSFRNLPSVDHAIFLVNAAKFHIGQLFHLFEEEEFMQHLHDFYASPMEKAKACRVWYIQFLVLLALGKTAVASPANDVEGLPGADLFTRAMSLLPDMPYLFRDSLTAIEALCSISLFLQRADMRNSSFIYIGQASRMALVNGLHRNRPAKDWPVKLAGRYQRVWWTVYILDMTLASSMGVPVSIQDEDITTPMPTREESYRSASLHTHVRLSSLTALVVNKVYGAEGRLQASFLPAVRQVLGKIASIAGDLSESFPLFAEGSQYGVSRVAAHLHLYYHQSILLTMYPVILYLFEVRLRGGETNSTASRVYSEPTQALLHTVAESCNSMQRILVALHQEGLLDTCVPFDLERVFSCSFVAKMLIIAFPSAKINSTLHAESIMILDGLISRGYIPAQYRKIELEFMDTMINMWDPKEVPGVPLHQDGPRSDLVQEPSAACKPDEGHNTNPGDLEQSFGFMNNLSPGQIMSLAQLMSDESQQSQASLGYGIDWMDSWIWEQNWN